MSQETLCSKRLINKRYGFDPRYLNFMVPEFGYGMKTNWCHYFICILLELYMFRVHTPIFRRVRTAVHTTIGSVSVPLCSRALYVEIQQYTNKIVTSVGFYSIFILTFIECRKNDLATKIYRKFVTLFSVLFLMQNININLNTDWWRCTYFESFTSTKINFQ